MTVSITIFNNDNYWNAGPYKDDILPEQTLVDPDSTSSHLNIRAYSPDGLVTASIYGSFQYDGPPTTVDKVSGTISSMTVSINGELIQSNTFTQPANLMQWLYPSDSQAHYLHVASILFQGIDFVGSTATREKNSDKLIGGGGKDSFTSFAGKIARGDAAYFDGKGGIDTAVFQGAFSQYTVSSQSFTDQTDMDYVDQVDGYLISDSVRSRNGYTQVTNVERLSFTDTMLALDTGADDNAGNAYLLYQAAFDRVPDVEGLGYWISKMDQGVNIVRDVAQNFILSDEFTRLYGPNPTTTQFTNLLYQNVLHRLPDESGLKYWLDEFARDGDSLYKRATTLNNFAISAENIANVADQIVDGIQYQAYVG